MFIILSMFSTFMCITFAAEPYAGFRFDLRHIVLIISTLAGGPVAGGVVWIIMNAYRVFFGGDGVVPALLSSTILYILLLLMHPVFIKSGLWKKILLSIVTSMIFSIGWIPTFVSHVGDPRQYITHIVIYQLCSTIAAILILYLMEILNSQVKLQEELINAEKFQLIGEMAASISHEIRNPLTSTRGFLQLLQSNSCSEEEKKIYLDIAINGIDQANHVLTDYLTFAKPSIDKVQTLQLEQEVLNVLTLMTPMANFANVVIQYDKPAQPLLIHGEKQKLHQCLLNIMKNCIEAMPDGGTLSIKLQKENEAVRLFIEDTGIGMSEEQLRRLGSPFYSTKEKGTGLGMMVVISVVKALGGTIEINSEPNVGTTFTLTFPIVQNKT